MKGCKSIADEVIKHVCSDDEFIKETIELRKQMIEIMNKRSKKNG